MRVAVYQGPDPSMNAGTEDNLRAFDRAAAQAASQGADILVTPELGTTGYNIGPQILEVAQLPDGQIAHRVVDLCRRHGIAVVYGYPERNGDAIYNAVQVIDANGAPLAHHRKTHLFGDLDVAHFQPGANLVTQFSFDGLTCGLAVCYDVEFPEVARAHADAGTDVLLVPTGLMEPWDVVPRILLPARAYESQLYIAYANHCGNEEGLEYAGLSCVVAPDGSDLARAGRAEELILADVDAETLRASRDLNTHLGDRRRDLY